MQYARANQRVTRLKRRTLASLTLTTYHLEVGCLAYYRSSRSIPVSLFLSVSFSASRANNRSTRGKYSDRILWKMRCGITAAAENSQEYLEAQRYQKYSGIPAPPQAALSRRLMRGKKIIMSNLTSGHIRSTWSK